MGPGLQSPGPNPILDKTTVKSALMISYADWQAARLTALTAADGWLNLTDRIVLGQGPQSLGSGPQNDLILSVGPSHLGSLTLASPNAASLVTATGAQDFQPHPGAGPRLTIAGLLLEIHTVDGVPALRVRDLSIRPNPRLTCFPFDPAWVIPATWAALTPPRVTGVDMIGGTSVAVTITHVARFTHAGHSVTLLRTHQKDGRPMFVIRDATSGRQTYAAGRFLIAEPAGDRIVLDFNRAHTPPCGFTDFAICPLPPPENRLPFAVPAGELTP